MPRVVEINDPARLREFHLAWQLLLPQTRHGSFFQSLDWLECYWKHFGDEQQLRVLMIVSRGSPIGIMPLVVRSEPTRVGSSRILTYPLHDWGTCFGPIGPNPTATLTTGLRHIAETPRDWDAVDLRWVDRRNVDHGRTQTTMSLAGLGCVERVWKRTATVNLDGGWEKYSTALSSKRRCELRRVERRLAEKGELRFERFRPPPANSEVPVGADPFDECVDLARRSWQGNSQDGTTLSHDKVAPFFRESHEAALRAGAVDMAVLRLDERPLAFAYNYHFAGRVYGLRTGFDPAFAKSGAGSVLWTSMLQDSCERGDSLFDLGPDSPNVKKRWATEFTPVYHYRHYARGRGSLLRIKDWIVDRTSQRTRRTKSGCWA